MNGDEFLTRDARLIAFFAINGILPIRQETRRKPDTGQIKGLFIYERTANVTCLHNIFIDGSPRLVSPYKLLNAYQDAIRELRALAAAHKD